MFLEGIFWHEVGEQHHRLGRQVDGEPFVRVVDVDVGALGEVHVNRDWGRRVVLDDERGASRGVLKEKYAYLRARVPSAATPFIKVSREIRFPGCPFDRENARPRLSVIQVS